MQQLLHLCPSLTIHANFHWNKQRRCRISSTVRSVRLHIRSLEVLTKLSCAVIYVLTEERCGKSTAQYECYLIYRHG